jgi:hypothetical protein
MYALIPGFTSAVGRMSQKRNKMGITGTTANATDAKKNGRVATKRLDQLLER